MMEQQAPYVTGLKCPQCGHALHEHHHWGACSAFGCACHHSRKDIELDAWRSEALAARVWLSDLQGQMFYRGNAFPDFSTRAALAYEAAIVK